MRTCACDPWSWGCCWKLIMPLPVEASGQSKSHQVSRRGDRGSRPPPFLCQVTPCLHSCWCSSPESPALSLSPPPASTHISRPSLVTGWWTAGECLGRGPQRASLVGGVVLLVFTCTGMQGHSPWLCVLSDPNREYIILSHCPGDYLTKGVIPVGFKTVSLAVACFSSERENKSLSSTSLPQKALCKA